MSSCQIKLTMHKVELLNFSSQTLNPLSSASILNYCGQHYHPTCQSCSYLSIIFSLVFSFSPCLHIRATAKCWGVILHNTSKIWPCPSTHGEYKLSSVLHHSYQNCSSLYATHKVHKVKYYTTVTSIWLSHPRQNGTSEFLVLVN